MYSISILHQYTVYADSITNYSRNARSSSHNNHKSQRLRRAQGSLASFCFGLLPRSLFRFILSKSTACLEKQSGKCNKDPAYSLALLKCTLGNAPLVKHLSCHCSFLKCYLDDLLISSQMEHLFASSFLKLVRQEERMV